MLGLGNYESSSEDEIEKERGSNFKQEMIAPQAEILETQQNKTQHTSNGQPAEIPETTLNRKPSGPVLGPMHEEFETQKAIYEQSSTSGTFIHDLTLPPVPNLDIPPSPPGSPNPSANAKFAHFLSLKKQDVHFNDKLAGSISLKNPSLLRKMMEHAGVDEQAQYSSSLPPELWNISSLPNWGYKEELLKVQRARNAKTEGKLKGQRDMIAFVSGSSRPGSTSYPK